MCGWDGNVDKGENRDYSFPTLLERYSDGLMPVHRRNARVNALCWE